ncbi:DMT family transporter [Vibrio ostreicida]|uniref:DMT family transporter n=1 Tax=Vibrio ostreicida TaxID=526588 RepID=A0ABT8BZF7_9VIBR|nr:DMT family transporter [Vibrio ostreicida]MDN3612481.1 DMT family transporter [Vibrio ostreicida]NPD10188.1 DMT family transporter [Vibrio ostreicida]
MLVRWVPFVFVVLWASGFVGARLGLQYAEPATLLTIRMMANVVMFFVLVHVLGRAIPRKGPFFHSCVVGIFIHGFYLGGTYMAIHLGMPAGLSSLLVGLQPIFTAVLLVVFTRERFVWSQWMGLALGFVGIGLVLFGKVQWQLEQHKLLAIGFCLLSLIGITLGTLYQRRFCHGGDKLGSALVQYMAAGCLFLPYALLNESMQVHWTIEFMMTLGWLVVVLSGFAVLLLLYMVEHGAASKVACVFYLVPPVTAVQAWLIFDESFDRWGMLGFMCAAMAVYLVVKAPTFSRLGRSERPLGAER